MSDGVAWNALYAFPNADGSAFPAAMRQSMEAGRLNAARSAMSMLATDPHNPRALQILAKADPQSAMQYQQQLIESAKAGLAEHQDSILKGAEIIRQFNPQDQATWDQARQAAAMAGIDISQVPAQFDPAYVQGIVHIADAFKPEANPPQDPGIIREYDIATQRGLIPQGTTFEQYVASRNPGAQAPVIIPNNVHQVGGGVPVTATGPNGEKVQFNSQTGQWEPMGGPTPQASGGFSQ